MENNKRPLVLFTGGLDSTYLLINLLETTDVDVLYIEGGQGSDKASAEMAARRKILDYIMDNDFKHSVIDEYVVKVPLDMRKNKSRFFCRDKKLEQPYTWLYAATGAVNGHVHSEVVMAYVSGDSVCSNLDNITVAWDALQKVTHWHPVPIRFPLHCITKDTILREFDKSDLYYPLRNMTWVCELPERNGTDICSDESKHVPCGKCLPCVTRAQAEQRYRQSKRTKLVWYPHWVPLLVPGESYQFETVDWASPFETVIPGQVNTRTFLEVVTLDTIVFLKVRDDSIKEAPSNVHLIAATSVITCKGTNLMREDGNGIHVRNADAVYPKDGLSDPYDHRLKTDVDNEIKLIDLSTK